MQRRGAGKLVLGFIIAAGLGAAATGQAVVQGISTRIVVGRWEYEAWQPITFTFRHTDQLKWHYERKGYRLPSLFPPVVMMPGDRLTLTVGPAKDAIVHIHDEGSGKVVAEWGLNRRS